MLTLIGQSTAEPVSIAEARTYMRLESTDSTAEDTLIGAYITAARQLAENITKRALVQSTWQIILNEFCNSTQAIDLLRPPISTASTSVVITYVENNTAGNSTIIPSTAYTIDADKEPGRVYPSYNNYWPTNSIRLQEKSVTIQYASGYNSSTIPAPVKIWIQQRVASMYDNREPIIIGQTVENMPRDFVNGLLDPYMILTATT